METTKKKHTFIERRAQGYSFDKIDKEFEKIYIRFKFKKDSTRFSSN